MKDKARFLALGGPIWCMKRGIGRFLDTGRRNANFGKIGMAWGVAWAVARWVLGVGRRFGALAAALLELVNL